VALTREVKKGRKAIGRFEAKAIKTKQAASDITPGARMILQSTIEENTRMLSDFLELVNKGALGAAVHSKQAPPSPTAAAPPAQVAEAVKQAQAAQVRPRGA
jgi:hypothetical protein